MNFFITGTDTNVGKTIISAWLVHHLRGKYWKPIQSGHEDGKDSSTVKALANIDSHRIYPEIYSLKAPLSPHAAAELEDVEISLNIINLPPADAPLIVEGAGGILVPLNKNNLMIDLMRKFELPVIVVARSTLGTINHTCLTLNELRSKNIPIAGVIINGPLNPSNKKAIEYYGNINVIAELDVINPLTHENLANYPLDLSLLQESYK